MLRATYKQVPDNPVLFFLIITGQTLWPIQLCITSLPPNVRMNFRYLLLAGVWLGPVKPMMDTILRPVLESIHKLYTEGLEITTPNGRKILKAKLLGCVFDLPAKAMSLNCKQWNGHYGCSYCLDEGTQVSHRRLYLPNDQHTPRIEKDTIQHAVEAVSNSAPVFGIKGPSILSPYLNIVKDVPIDYMHAALEGVIKTLLLKFWFNGKYKDYRFYLGRESGSIDEILNHIHPPHEFRRSTRSITTVKYWKASELRAWLLFYSVPILLNFLPFDYVHHLSLLVKSMHILLSTEISTSDLEAAENMLSVFYGIILKLYPQEVCTINVHSVIHLIDCVRNFGPLWSFSCFGFESGNGHFKKHCHGTRNVLPQLVTNYRFHQSFSDKKYKDQFGNEPLGRIRQKTLSEVYCQVLQKSGFATINNTTFTVFYRYRLNGTVYQAKVNDSRLRDSSVCMFTRKDGKKAVASIRCFCFCNKTPIAIIKVFSNMKNAFTQIPPATISELCPYALNSTCIFSVNKLSSSDPFHSIPVSSIIKKCVHVSIKNNPLDFIVPLPNNFEHH